MEQEDHSTVQGEAVAEPGPHPISRWNAWLPLVMSDAALVLVIVHFARFGSVPAADGGLAFSVFQVLIGAQIPVIAYFAITWMPKRPGPALLVLMVQAVDLAVALGALYLLPGL